MMFKSLDKDLKVSKSLLVSGEEEKKEEEPKQISKQNKPSGAPQLSIVEIVE
jgi:hypothetical protein